MNNSVTFVYQEPTFVEPDFNIISQTVKNLSRLPFFKTETMQSLQQKGQRVVGYTQTLDTTLRTILPQRQVQLKNNGLASQFDDLADIQEALQDSSSSADDRAVLEDEINAIEKDIGQTIQQIRTSFNESASQLDRIVVDIKSVVLQERTEDILADKQSQQSALEKNIADLQAKRAQLQEEQAQLRKSIAVLNQHNVADMFADYIPSAESLEGMDLKQPEVEVVKQSLELYKKLFQNISEGIKYSELADALDLLNQRVRDIDQQMEAIKTQRNDVNNTIEDLSTVLAIHQQRNTLVAEIEKISGAWRLFVQRLESSGSSPLDAQTMLNLVNQQETYITDIIAAQNSVILR